MSDSVASQLEGLGEPIERPPSHRLKYDDDVVEGERLVAPLLTGLHGGVRGA